jgi:hypothetical protein
MAPWLAGLAYADGLGLNHVTAVRVAADPQRGESGAAGAALGPAWRPVVPWTKTPSPRVAFESAGGRLTTL